MSASIIICTHNRAQSLAQTLRALGAMDISLGFETELIVVDNGSTDDTAQVARDFASSNMPLRLLHEPKKGQTYARNAGLEAARGDIMVFTDDDLRHPAHWLSEMVRPIFDGYAHAVVGGVRCAPHLMRSWMKPIHMSWLACTEHLNQKTPKELVGANMAFAREVLTKVPGFDTDLGPGACGFADDTLFSAQLLQAGFRIVSAFHVVSEHHFQEERLQRASFLNAALKMARSKAYMDYHWEHRKVTALPLRLLRSRLRLDHWRRRHPQELERKEGIQASELQHVFAVKYFEAIVELAGAPRNYDRHGFIKLTPCSKAVEPNARAA